MNMVLISDGIDSDLLLVLDNASKMPTYEDVKDFLMKSRPEKFKFRQKDESLVVTDSVSLYPIAEFFP